MRGLPEALAYPSLWSGEEHYDWEAGGVRSSFCEPPRMRSNSLKETDAYGMKEGELMDMARGKRSGGWVEVCKGGKMGRHL